uniref:MADS-box domain-containing protein n=1 Tax=Setaria italica TaxID=4555 RepID=K3ZDZ1_SETIT
MPRRGGKIKIQWIAEKAVRQAAFRKRHTTLFDKARDLSILCQVQAAVVVYGRGEAEPKVWPGVPEVTEILQRYPDLPGSLKEAHKLDNEIFARQRAKKMRRKVDSCKATARRLEVNLVLNDVSIGRRRDFDDLPRELTAAVVSVLNAFRSVTADRVNFLRSADAQEAAFSPPLEEAAALMALREPPMVPPVAMAAPVVANAPFMQPTPPQSALVVPLEEEEEPPMVPPLAMAPFVADAPLLLPAPELEPAPLQSELVVSPVPELEDPQMIADALLLLELELELEPELAPAQSELVEAPAPAPQEPPMVAEESLLPLLAPEPEPAPLQSEVVVAPAPEPQDPQMIADALLLPLAPEPEPAPLQSELVEAPPPAPQAPPTVADAPLLLPAPEPASELVVVPASPPQEPPMVADASLLLPAVEPESQATAAGMGADELLNLDAEPRNGSFLLEMADAIVDDGSGRQATAEDVDRLLREHGLESFKP